jgi:ribosomal protein S12 methylthiotransferase
MAEGKILAYLDVPLQHGSKRVLKAMRRPAASEQAVERIRRWRELCPDITLRSTFIVGFPGETEAEFEELLDFIQEVQLDRVGCFAYSPVQGALANELTGQLPEEVKEERRARFMAAQESISADRLQRRIGKPMRVLVDARRGQLAVARGPGDAPEIDGVVIIESAVNIEVGQFVEVDIVAAETHDLRARIITNTVKE